MGRLEDIIERNKNPRTFRRGRFPTGIAVAFFVLIIIVLVIFTDLGAPKPTTPPPSPTADPTGERRVRGIELRGPKRAVVRDAGASHQD